MRKIRNLIGMPVICHRQKIGRLVQAKLSDDLRCLEGIWVDCGLRGTRYIPSDQLSLIGEMAVMADDRGTRRRCGATPILKRAIGTDGSRLGAIVGAEIDEITFLVCSLELTLGFWDDLFFGRSRVERFSVQGSEIIVQDSAQDDLKEVES